MTRLAIRPRIFALLILAWPVGVVAYGYLSIAFFVATNQGCGGEPRPFSPFPYQLCSGSTGHRGLAILLLLVALFMLGVIGALMVRWSVQPLEQITQAVRSLGPDSTGIRLRPTGLSGDPASVLAREVDAMLERLHQGYESQRRFAANASHELRTPLATQRTLVEVSMGGALTEERSQMLAELLLATNRRNEALIEGLLALAETDQGLLSRSPQRLDEIVDNVVRQYQDEALARSVELRDETEPVVVAGESPLLERLVSNLVDNALKYNETDGWVSVRLTKPGTLMVANSGPAVDSTQVGALFDAFRRVDGDRLSHAAGVGLGLTIVRSIAKAHGGAVTAQARPEGGLVVEVVLPPEARPTAK